MKRFVALFLIFILIFSFTTPSYATLIEGLHNVNPSDSFNPEFESDRGESYAVGNGEGSDGIGSFTQIVVDIINDILGVLTQPLTDALSIFPTIEGAIWGLQDFVQITFFDSEQAGIAGTFRSTVGSCYNALRYLVAAFYVIILVYLGIRMILSSVGKQKAHYKDLLKYWLTGLLLLFAFHWVMALIIWCSDTITAAFANVGQAALSGTGSVLTSRITYYITSQTLAAVFPPLAFIVIPIIAIELIVLITFGVIITFTYLKRLFTIALLIVLFPLVVLSYVFDKIGDRRAQTFGIWFKEFTVNVFVQPIHAFLLMLLAYFLGSSLLDKLPVINAILALLSLALIPIGEKQIKQLFQINSSMGPGSGGIVGSVAHAGMAMNTLKSLGSSVVGAVQKSKNLKNAESFTKEIINKRGDKAYHEAIAKGKSESEAKQASNNAKISMARDLTSSAKYKKKMKELTGHTSLAEARKEKKLKLASGIVGGSVGAGYALVTTTSAGDLLGNIAKSSISGVATANTFADMGWKLHELKQPMESPELDEVENWAQGDLDKLSEDKKEQIAKILGINKEAINNSPKNRALIKRKIESKRRGLKYGLNYDNPLVDYLDEDYDEIQNIMGGWDPKDPTQKINWKNFRKSVTKDGMYLQDIRDGGKMYHIPALANSKAGDKIIWQEAEQSNEEFKVSLENRAIRLADTMAENGAFEKGSKQYRDFLKDEKKDMATHYSAHVKTTETLESINHNMITHQPLKMYSSVEKRIQTMEDTKDYLTVNQLSDMNSKFTEFHNNLNFNPNDVVSRQTAINTLQNLYDNGAPTYIENACRLYGTNYTAIQNGTVDDSALKNITKKIQTDISKDSFKIDYANKIDVSARANETISNIITDGTISQKNMDFAIATATNGSIKNITSQNMQTVLQNCTNSQKTLFVDTCNQLMAEEKIVSPHAQTVAYANKNGNIDTNISFSNISNNVSQMLGNSTETLGTYKVSPLDPNTGKSTVIFTPSGEPSKAFTFESDINTGGDIEVTYAGKATTDANGNVTLLRSEGELEYSFDDSMSSAQSNYDEDFNDFSLGDIQSYIHSPDASTHTKFTVIKNSDICAIIDNATNTVLFVKDGISSVVDKTTQFTVELDPSSNNLKLTSAPFAELDVFSRYRLTNYSKDHKEDTKLINRLLGK